MKNREILFIIRMRNQARAALNSLGSDLKQAATSARAAADGVAKVNRSAKGTAQSFQRGANAALSFSLGLRRVVNILGAVGAGLSIGAIINETVVATKNFETSLSRIVGLVGVSSERVKAFGDEILKLGGDTAKAPTELADAMFFITSAGLRGQDALDALTASAKASAGGLGETKVVADAVTSALNAYADQNFKASQITDIFTATVREGKLEATDLARSIGQVLPIAQNAGVRLDEVGASVAALTQVGLKSSSAIAGLRGVLVAFNRQSEEAKPILKILGTSFDEIKKNIRERGLLTALKDLRARVGDNDAALTKIFGDVEAVNTVLALTGGNVQKVTGIFDRMTNTVGATDVAFDEAAKTVQFKLDRAFAKLQASLIKIGSVVLPPIADALVVVADHMDTVAKIAISLAVIFGGRLVRSVASFAAGLIGLGGAAAGATGAMRLLGTVMKALKITLILEAVDGLVNLIQNFNKEVADGVTTWTLFGAAGRAVLGTIGEALGRVLSGLGALGTAFAELLKGNINSARANAVAAAISLASATGVSFKKRLNDELKDIAQTVKNRLDLKNQIDVDQVFEDVLPEDAATKAGGKAGAAAGAATGQAFLSAIQKFGTLEKFTGALDQLVTKFAPEIGKTKELADALKVLEVAGTASTEQLKALGLTKKQLAEITERVKEAQKQETSEVEKAIAAANRRIQVAGVDKAARETEAKVLKVVAAAKAKNQKIDENEVALLRQRLALAKQQEARAQINQNLGDTIKNLQTQAELLGATEQQRRRILAVEQLKNAAHKEGLQDISKELDLLNTELDKLDQAEARFRGDAFGGAIDGIKRFAMEAGNLRSQFDDFALNTLGRVSDAIAEFANTGKFNFSSFADFAIKELQRIAAQRIVAEIANAFSTQGGGNGGGGGGDNTGQFAQLAGTIAAAFASSGGVVGRNAGHGRFGRVPAAAFANAQRFQFGGQVQPRGTDSVPILATPGEVVLTEDQAGFLRRALEGRNVGGVARSPSGQQPLGGAQSGVPTAGVNVTVAMNITTPDVGAFRRSQQQIGAETAGSINRALRRNG